VTVHGPIDLLHQGNERVIASYIVDTDEGPALVDCGPTTCVDALEAALGTRGLALTDVRHLLLTHIHLDHAGAAGVLVRRHPGLRVHVSGIGAPHLVDPQKLESSARRLYGDSFDTLWGELAPVPEANVEVVGDRVVGLACFPTPGHASHHVSFLAGDGTLFAGDAAGVRILPGEHILPVAPPPDIDLEAWSWTLNELEWRQPQRLALPHFGVVDDPAAHLARMRESLDRWAEWVGEGMEQDEFVGAAFAELEAAEGPNADVYELAAPLWQSYAGLRRYWDKRADAS
jgi:glyoxylase-like metal-dependent hydrolase (beta-lactamase superfamily II)